LVMRSRVRSWIQRTAIFVASCGPALGGMKINLRHG
jgi:hypothetical protein